MRSRWPFFWFALAAVCGAFLFHTSQRATDGRARLAAIEADTAREEEAIRVLSAEWSYLNQPGRLEKLARAHLGLEPMKGSQFISADKLEGLAEIETAAGDPVSAPALRKAAIALEPKPARVLPQKSKPVVAAKKPAAARAIITAEPTVVAAEPQPAPLKSLHGRSFGDVMQALGVD